MQTITLPEIAIPDHSTDTPLGALRVPGVHVPQRLVVIEPQLVQELINAARLATDTAYTAYADTSYEFKVGAAVIMADDPEQKIFTAANCENTVFNSGICAERALLHFVVAQGFRMIKYLAVSTPNRTKDDVALRSPCGLCRQTIAEFADDKTLVFIDHQKPGVLADVVDLARLLPYSFRMKNLQK